MEAAAGLTVHLSGANFQAMMRSLVMPLVTGAPVGDSIQIHVACPLCGVIQPRVFRIVAARARRTDTRPITPEIVDVCDDCAKLLVIALWPAGRTPP